MNGCPIVLRLSFLICPNPFLGNLGDFVERAVGREKLIEAGTDMVVVDGHVIARGSAWRTKHDLFCLLLDESAMVLGHHSSE